MQHPEGLEQPLKNLIAPGVLDASREKAFDDLVRVAALACDTEFAAISFVDEGRCWVKALEGNLDKSAIPRCEAFSGHVMLSRKIAEVPDIQLDSRFVDHPVAHGGPRLRFHAGIPLVLSCGSAVGTLCIFGREPKQLTAGQREQLTLLASQVVALIEERNRQHLLEQLPEDAISRARLLEKVAEITRNAVIVTCAAGKIEWVNAGFESGTGYRLDEVLGRKPGDFLQGPETSPEAIRRIGARLRSGQGVSQEILNYSKDGTAYWIDLDIQPVRDELGRLRNYVAVQTNITRLKQQEEALRLARDEAERASRLKSAFVANVSHELRTPLNGILGISEYLCDAVPTDFTDDLSILHRSARHLLHILNRLIDLASIEAGAMTLASEPFGLLSLLQESLDLFETNAGNKGLVLALVAPEITHDLWLKGDETRLRQVLMNLVGNAIKFTEKGSVTLYCSTSEVSAGEVNVELAIEDTGPGISETDHKRIFQHFERLDSPAAGAGLGLAISQEILSRMNSRLTVTSTMGEGSRFSFGLSFPRAASPQSDNRQGLKGTSNASQDLPCQVLVVDDDPVNLKVMQKLLGKLGVSDIRVCQSGAEALDEWQGLRPEIVLVDIRMPAMNGYSFLERYRLQESFSGDAPLMVACSASNSKEDQQNFRAAGFDRFLGKPVALASLGRLLSVVNVGNAPGELPPDSGGVAAGGSVITDSLKSNMANNDKLIYGFLEQIAQTHDQRWADIDPALADNSVGRLATAIHTLKGQVAYFGDESAIYQKAFAADKALKADDQTAPVALVEVLRQETQQFIDEIRQELAKKFEKT